MSETKAPGLFEVIDDLSEKKKGILSCLGESQFNKAYNSYMVNRAFSLFPDTIILASIMNRMHHLAPLLQHDFYFHGVDARRRKTGWPKALKDHEDIETIAAFYDVSKREARDYLGLLTAGDIASMRRSLDTGGKGKRTNDNK